MASMSVMIHFPFWLGDALMAVPFARRYARQNRDERLIAVVDPAIRAVVSRALPEAEIWEFKKTERKELCRRLCEERPEEVCLLTNSVSSFFPYWRAGVPRRVGFGNALSRWLLTRKCGHVIRASQGESNLALLREKHPLPIKAENDPPILTRKRNNNLPSVLMVFPGANYGPAKHWGAERFAAVIRTVLDSGWRIELHGAPGDIKECEEIAKLLGDHSEKVENLCGKMKLGELMEHFEKTQNSFALANDSGAMHLCAACGIPSVGLYLSTSHVWTPPAFGPAALLVADIECRPCFSRTCPLKTYACREGISTGIVTETLFQFQRKDKE